MLIDLVETSHNALVSTKTQLQKKKKKKKEKYLLVVLNYNQLNVILQNVTLNFRQIFHIFIAVIQVSC